MTLAAYNRKQIEYKLDISAGEVPLWGVGRENTSTNRSHPQFIASVYELEKAVSSVVGGCTIIPMRGAWCDVKRANLENYNGIQVGTEYGIQLQVKCELHKEDKLEEAIKQGIQAMRDKGLDIVWVCGTKETVNAFNFNMEEQG